MQTEHSQDLSRTRQKLLRLHEMLGRLLQIFLASQPILKGSVYEMKRKCGKPSCRCTRGELHSSMVLSWSEGGRTRLRTVPKGRLGQWRSRTRRYQKFRKGRARVVKITEEMLALIDKLEAARSKEA